MARRVGSASAPKVALSRSVEGLALVGFGTIWFNIGTGAETSSLANNHISFLPELDRAVEAKRSISGFRQQQRLPGSILSSLTSSPDIEEMDLAPPIVGKATRTDCLSRGLEVAERCAELFRTRTSRAVVAGYRPISIRDTSRARTD
jgi:hypothetical protein